MEGQQASSSKQPRISPYMVSTKQLVDVRNALARFFYTSNSALWLVEQEDLVLAFSCLGESKGVMPTRKVCA